MKAASLTRVLLAPRGRANTTTLVDGIVEEIGVARAETTRLAAVRSTYAGDDEPAAQVEPLGAAAPWPAQPYLMNQPNPVGTLNGANDLMAVRESVRLGAGRATARLAIGAGTAAPRKKVSVRIDPIRHRRIKHVALDLDISLQGFITRAIDHYLSMLSADG